MRRSSFLYMLAALTALPLAFTHAQNLTRPQVEAIVQQYIEKNGDKLISSITDFQNRQQQAAAMSAIRPYNPVMGAKDAPVTIVEFIDFECPFCSRVQPTLSELRQRYGSRIRWVAKYLPLEFHQKAPGASYAAQAAHIQGKFWPYSEKLWQRQEFLGDKLYVEIAKELGLNLKKFNADRASAGVKAAVDQDLKDAAAVGARGTPFFLVNGTPLSGAQPTEAFTAVIEQELAKAPKK